MQLFQKSDSNSDFTQTARNIPGEGQGANQWDFSKMLEQARKPEFPVNPYDNYNTYESERMSAQDDLTLKDTKNDSYNTVSERKADIRKQPENKTDQAATVKERETTRSESRKSDKNGNEKAHSKESGNEVKDKSKAESDDTRETRNSKKSDGSETVDHKTRTAIESQDDLFLTLKNLFDQEVSSEKNQKLSKNSKQSSSSLEEKQKSNPFHKQTELISIKKDKANLSMDELAARFSKKDKAPDTKSRLKMETEKGSVTQKDDSSAKDTVRVELDPEKWTVSGKHTLSRNSGEKNADGKLNPVRQDRTGNEKRESAGQGSGNDSSGSFGGRSDFLRNLQNHTKEIGERKETQAKDSQFNSLVRKARLKMGPEGTSSASIRLRPEALGELTMDIRVNRNHVEAKLLVDNEAAMKWIKDEIENLRHELKTHGVHVDQFSVKIKEQDAASSFLHDDNSTEQNLAGNEDPSGNKKGNDSNNGNEFLSETAQFPDITKVSDEYERVHVAGSNSKTGLNVTV